MGTHSSEGSMVPAKYGPGVNQRILPEFSRNIVGAGRNLNNLERSNAHSLAASCFEIVKSGIRHVQCLEKRVNKQEHDSHFKRIQRAIKKAIVDKEKAENHLKELESLEKKMADEECSQKKDLLLFDVLFDLTVDALDTCITYILYITKQLEDNFASMQSYLKTCSTVVSYSDAVGDGMDTLVPKTGKISGAAVGQHGFDVQSLQTSIASLKQIVSVGNHKRARDLAEEHKHLMSENNNLKTVPSQLTGTPTFPRGWKARRLERAD